MVTDDSLDLRRILFAPGFTDCVYERFNGPFDGKYCYLLTIDNKVINFNCDTSGLVVIVWHIRFVIDQNQENSHRSLPCSFVIVCNGYPRRSNR